MKMIETEFRGLYLVENSIHQDLRGTFFKPFEWKDIPLSSGDLTFREIYYSVNHEHVIRGMHFQNPPYQHTKMVWVSAGCILDVVLDIRKGSETFGMFYSHIFKSNVGASILIPPGFAHGFLCLEEGSIVNYAQTSLYSKDCDMGIHYDSFGYNWPEVNPKVSPRDMAFVQYNEFVSSFQ